MIWKKDKKEGEIMSVVEAKYNERVHRTRNALDEKTGNFIEMWAYQCERCLNGEERVFNAEDAKETFDYFYMSGSVLCPQCRIELEHYKNNPYKLRTILSLGHPSGDMTEDVEEVFPTIEAVHNAIERQDRDMEGKMLSMGLYLKEKKYVVTYVPYAERKG